MNLRQSGFTLLRAECLLEHRIAGQSQQIRQFVLGQTRPTGTEQGHEAHRQVRLFRTVVVRVEQKGMQKEPLGIRLGENVSQGASQSRVTGVEAQFFQGQSQEERAAALGGLSQGVDQLRGEALTKAGQGVPDEMRPQLGVERRDLDGLKGPGRLPPRGTVGDAGDDRGTGADNLGSQQT